MSRGIEFSIGTIVMLIIAILLFSLSLSFLFKWFGEAETLKEQIDRQTQDQIEAALATGTQKVAIPVAIRDVLKGTMTTFGVGVRNIDQEGPYSMSLAFSGAYAPDGSAIPVDTPYLEERWLGTFKVSEPVTIKSNGQHIFLAAIRADATVAQGKPTPKGDVVFNVCVWQGDPQPCDRSALGNTYTGKINQITVRIV